MSHGDAKCVISLKIGRRKLAAILEQAKPPSLHITFLVGNMEMKRINEYFS